MYPPDSLYRGPGGEVMWWDLSGEGSGTLPEKQESGPEGGSSGRSGIPEIQFSTARQIPARNAGHPPVLRSLPCARRVHDLMGDLLVHIILAAVGADPGRDLLDHESHAIPFERDRGRPFPGRPVPADNALHDFLLV